MRRLNSAIAALSLGVALAVSGCKPRDKVRLEPTKETVALATVVHMADPAASNQLVRGFHAVEQNSWRWTMGKFTVLLKPPAGSEKAGARLTAQISIPDPVIQAVKTTRLSASVGGSQLGSAEYSKPGEYTFTVDVPAATLGDEALTVDFALDRFLPAGAADSRELGLIVSSIGLEIR